ncbi:MAG: DUF5063 domain-containing protein [Bacteroidales bacterium]|nr:DUF5063 domain-containing protein [Bacteroidales bacterium]MBN2763786.1 DUF5063 domain-containing protein [Bacteroidales bacterium]
MEDLKSLQVKEYIEAARDYCGFIDEAASIRPVELFQSLQNHLANIYAKTSMVKKPKYCFEDEPQKFVKENEYALIHDRLQGVISKFNGAGSLGKKKQAGDMDILSFSLAESLTDIYQELKDSYQLYDVGLTQAMNDAIWSSLDNFEKQWGLQLIETLQSLHQLLYGHKLTSNQLQLDENEGVDEMDESWFSEEDDIPYDEE